MSAKDVVLRRVRSALGPDPVTPVVPRTYRGADAPPDASSSLLDRFIERVEGDGATVLRVDDGGIADAVASALADAGLVVVPPGLRDDWLPAGCSVIRDDGHLSATQLDTMDGVVTGASVGIAETGTLVLDGLPDQGRRAITLVPDLHVCVVLAEQVVGTVPAALARLVPTRPQTWISGPSATSDIELNRVEGVHGPRTLVIVVVDATSRDRQP